MQIIAAVTIILMILPAAHGTLIQGEEVNENDEPPQFIKSHVMSTGNTNLQDDPDFEGSSAFLGGTSDTSSRASWLGEEKVVVIAAEFPDKIASTSISTINTTVNTNMRNYYKEVSYDAFDISSTVVNNSWLMMPNNITYYTKNNKENFGKFIKHAIEAADDWLDFNLYRTQGSYVQLVIIVHSGRDEATSGDPLDIWSHMSSINPKSVDGSYVSQYCTVSEFSRTGTYAHEFGHLLGLPDLYDKDYSSNGIGAWGLMASGSHRNGGYTPAHFSAWSKVKLGWLTPTTISENLFDQPILDVERNQVVYRVPIPITEPNSEEYFLIENRQRVGFDLYLPASGLLIWHIDDAKFTSYAPNNNENHKLVDVEESTAIQHLDDRSNLNDGDSSDVWSNNPTGFTPDTSPNSDSYYGSSSKFYLEDISASGSTMTADFIVRHIFFSLDGPENRYANPGDQIVVNMNVTSDRGSEDSLSFTLLGSTNLEWGTLLTSNGIVKSESDKALVKILVTIPDREFPNSYCELSIKARSTDGTEFGSDTFKVTVSQDYSFHSEKPKDLVLDPGKAAINTFVLFNDGNVKNSYDVVISTKSSWHVVFWDSADSNPEIKAYSNTTLDIYVEIPSSANAEDWEVVTITLTSKSDSNEIQTKFNVTVNKIYGFELTDPFPGKEFYVDTGTNLNYEFSIENQANTEDTFTISILQEILVGTGTPLWKWNLLPDGKITIDVDETKNFYLDITIPAGVKAGESQQFKIMVVSEDGISNDTVLFELIINQHYGMDVELDSLTSKVKPDEKVYFNFKLTNTGNGDDIYNFSVSSSLPEGWTVLYPSDADATVGQGKTVRYSLILKAPPLTPAIKKKFTIKVMSTGNESLTSSFTEEIEIEIVHSVTITAITEERLSGKPGGILNFTITIENLGNDEETILLTKATSLHGIVMFKAALQGGTITSLTLKAGEKKNILVIFTLFNTLTEEAESAIQVKGSLEDQSETNEVWLHYKVDVEGIVIDDNGNGNNDKQVDSSELSGTTVATIGASIIIIIIVLIVVIWFVVIKKGRDKKKKAVMRKTGGYGQAPVPVTAEILPAAPPSGFPMPPQYAAAAPVSYDPMTGQPIETIPVSAEPVMAAPVGYDPATGQPVEVLPVQGEVVDEAPLRYDPMTGEPISALPPPPEEQQVQSKKRFDPMTGEPIENSEL
jgi:immune inhibitor A